MRRTTFRFRFLVACLVSAPLTFAPLGAPAQTPPAEKSADADAGRGHFDNAVSLFREGNYRAALVEFRRAHELLRNYRVLYNVAQTEFEVQDYAEALRTFRRYLAEGGAEIDAERRAQVEADIKRLAGRVATVTIVTSTVGAEVLVDDVPVGRTPLADGILVSAGRRKITLQKDDQPSVTRFVEVAGGDAPKVTIDLARPASAGPATVAPPVSAAPAAPPSEPSRAGFWVSFSATALLAAGGAAVGGVAIDSYNDTKAKLAQRGVAAADVEAAHSKTGSLAIAADVIGGAALAMGVLTVIIGVTGGKSEPAAAQKPAASVRVGPRGIELVGRF